MLGLSKKEQLFRAIRKGNADTIERLSKKIESSIFEETVKLGCEKISDLNRMREKQFIPSYHPLYTSKIGDKQEKERKELSRIVSDLSACKIHYVQLEIINAAKEIIIEKDLEDSIISLFKSNNNDIIQSALNLINEHGSIRLIKEIAKFNYEWAFSTLIQFKRIGVEALHHPLQFKAKVVETLGEFRDKRAIEPIKELISGELTPELVKNIVEALNTLEDTNKSETSEKLIAALNKKDNAESSHKKPDVDIQLIRWLGVNGDKESTEIVVNSLFSWNYIGFIFDKISKNDLKNLFKDYTEIILSTAGFNRNLKASADYCKIEYGGKNCKRYLYNDLIKELCDIETNISNNILNKVVDQTDKTIGLTYEQVSSDWDSKTEHVANFSRQRELAKNELEKRGNPKYDPKAFTDNSWTI